MKKEQQVYIVTAGRYSDYHIVCLFSNEDEAEAYASQRNQCDTFTDYRVEEYVVDAARPADRKGLIAFRVRYGINPRTPWLKESPWDAFAEKSYVILPFEHVHHEDSLHVGTNTVSQRWETWVWAKDKTEALKIGADRIMPMLAAMQIEEMIPSS